MSWYICFLYNFFSNTYFSKHLVLINNLLMRNVKNLYKKKDLKIKPALDSWSSGVEHQ